MVDWEEYLTSQVDPELHFALVYCRFELSVRMHNTEPQRKLEKDIVRMIMSGFVTMEYAFSIVDCVRDMNTNQLSEYYRDIRWRSDFCLDWKEPC